ncbi:MAG: pentapeptide repeat-containing protein [Hyphomicrobium sp.]
MTIIGTRFDGADLSDTSFLRPSTFSTLAAPASEAASFVATKLTRARLFGRFNRMSFRGADLSGATLAPFNRTGFIEHIWRTELSGADLSGADLSRADLTYVQLSFANLRGANLSGAVLKKADLSRADLTGADLTGVDLADADLDGAILTGTRGLNTALGLDSARNVEKSIR